MSLPTAIAREITPAEMIAEGLPRKKTLKSATKAEFLAAVCSAVRKHRSAAAALTPAAVGAHPEYAGEIIGSLLRCSGKLDCEFVGSIVSAACAVEGAETTSISDAAMAKAPECAETIRETARRAAREEGKAPSAPGGAEENFDPREALQPVCVNGTQRAIRASLLDEFLAANPGAVVGTCQITPPTNR
ncbi:MAG: hypothetical protein M3Q46_13375 [Verrucomicrobiota bacterium]|nr:hypothetical protein [Verrucomicrobiota bacterium]